MIELVGGKGEGRRTVSMKKKVLFFPPFFVPPSDSASSIQIFLTTRPSPGTNSHSPHPTALFHHPGISSSSTSFSNVLTLPISTIFISLWIYFYSSNPPCPKKRNVAQKEHQKEEKARRTCELLRNLKEEEQHGKGKKERNVTSQDPTEERGKRKKD